MQDLDPQQLDLQRLGRYLLIKRISVGGMAEVYLARSSSVHGFEKIVAIKRILPRIAEDEDFRLMFIDEAQISARLNHANIGQVFEFGAVEDEYFIAMEYIAGQDLRTIRRSLLSRHETLPVPLALHVVTRICQALDYAHGMRFSDGRPMEIIHRDVSPPNILISYSGQVKLIDFGIARAASRATQTHAGKLKGKFAYMSPEQVEGRPLDHRSDIFSAGIVLFEMLTNRRPFAGKTHLETVNLVCRHTPDAPSTINPEVPLEVDRIVLKALAKNVEDRYGSAGELRKDVERFVARTKSTFEAHELSAWMCERFSHAIEAQQALMRQLNDLQLDDLSSVPAAGSSAMASLQEEAAVAESSASEDAGTSVADAAWSARDEAEEDHAGRGEAIPKADGWLGQGSLRVTGPVPQRHGKDIRGGMTGPPLVISQEPYGRSRAGTSAQSTPGGAFRDHAPRMVDSNPEEDERDERNATRVQPPPQAVIDAARGPLPNPPQFGTDGGPIPPSPEAAAGSGHGSPPPSQPSAEPGPAADSRSAHRMRTDAIPSVVRVPAGAGLAERLLARLEGMRSYQLIVVVASLTLILGGAVALTVSRVRIISPRAPTAEVAKTTSRPAGTLILRTSPPSYCAVILDEKPLRILEPGGPVVVNGVAAGRHELTLDCHGFYRFDRRVVLKPGRSLAVQAALTPISSHDP